VDIHSGNEKGSTDNEINTSKSKTSKKNSVNFEVKGYQSEGSESSIGSLGKKFKMFNLNCDGN